MLTLVIGLCKVVIIDLIFFLFVRIFRCCEVLLN